MRTKQRFYEGAMIIERKFLIVDELPAVVSLDDMMNDNSMVEWECGTL